MAWIFVSPQTSQGFLAPIVMSSVEIVRVRRGYESGALTMESTSFEGEEK